MRIVMNSSDFAAKTENALVKKFVRISPRLVRLGTFVEVLTNFATGSCFVERVVVVHMLN